MIYLQKVTFYCKTKDTYISSAYFLRWKSKHVFQMLLLKIPDIGEIVESALIIKNSSTFSIESIHNINHQTVCRMKLENMLNHS